MYGFIYITTNNINGKRYIGQHKWNNENTIDKCKYLGSGPLLIKAIKKYGKENFSRQTIEICNSFEEINEAERWWIKTYDACKRDDFYNISDGGHNGNSLAGKTLEEIQEKSEKCRRTMASKSEEELKEIYLSRGRKGEANTHFGVPMTQNAKELLATAHTGMVALSKDDVCVFEKDSNKIEDLLNDGWTLGNCHQNNHGENNPMYGRHQSEESKQKMRDSMPDLSGENSPMFNKSEYSRVLMICPETNEILQIFETPARAADFIKEKYNLTIYKSSNIISSCKNKFKKNGQLRLNHGAIWRFEDDLTP